MNHDDDVGSGGQGEAVTGFLIASVPAISGMHFHLNTVQSARDGDGFIPAGVVYQNDKIDYPLGHDLRHRSGARSPRRRTRA